MEITNLKVIQQGTDYKPDLTDILLDFMRGQPGDGTVNYAEENLAEKVHKKLEKLKADETCAQDLNILPQ